MLRIKKSLDTKHVEHLFSILKQEYSRETFLNDFENAKERMCFEISILDIQRMP